MTVVAWVAGEGGRSSWWSFRKCTLSSLKLEELKFVRREAWTKWLVEPSVRSSESPVDVGVMK
jgi:hypothetical protein